MHSHKVISFLADMFVGCSGRQGYRWVFPLFFVFQNLPLAVVVVEEVEEGGEEEEEEEVVGYLGNH